jgi:hypothetical protein
MKGFQNDIDAYIQHRDRVYMLELKRPKENANTWKPYRSDSSNYLQFASFCSAFDYELTNIAYTEAQPGKMKVFRDVTFSNQKLHYVTANLEIDPDDEILFKIELLEFHKEVSTR